MSPPWIGECFHSSRTVLQSRTSRTLPLSKQIYVVVFTCASAAPHLALWEKSMGKMIRSQPSVMSAMVKSIGEDEDESMPCRPTAGSLTTRRKTIHASRQTDIWCCLGWKASADMLYDTVTVSTLPGLEDVSSSLWCWHTTADWYLLEWLLLIFSAEHGSSV